jgi:hypothetical protein
LSRSGRWPGRPCCSGSGASATNGPFYFLLVVARARLSGPAFCWG